MRKRYKVTLDYMDSKEHNEAMRQIMYLLPNMEVNHAVSTPDYLVVTPQDLDAVAILFCLEKKQCFKVEDYE